MDRGRQHRGLNEPLLPPGRMGVIEKIVEEKFPDNFHDELTEFIINEDEMLTNHHPNTTANNIDSNTSVSSTSTNSYIGINSGSLGNPSQKSFAYDNSIIANHSQKAFASDSSSFHSSGSSHHYGYMNEETENPLLHQNPFYSPSTTGGVIGSSENSDLSTTTSDDENDPLKDIEPTIHPVPDFDVSDYLPHNLVIEFIDLKNRVFEKQQSRKDKKARQRVIEGKVKIAVSSEENVASLKVWVRREPQAATLCNDKNGDVELTKLTLLRHTTNKWLYVVDLDSVYEGRERPVYELAKVEMNDRNIFELIAQVTLQNGQKSKKEISNSFLIRTFKRPYQDDATQSSSGNKRPNTWHSSAAKSKSPRYSPRPNYSADYEVDSSVSPIGSSSGSSSSHTNAMNLDKIIVEHLEAQRAHIDHLTFGSIKTKRGDIAYHIRLTDQARDKSLTEGVVVGFFPSDGKTKIEPLSSVNVRKAVMAGVISRSAYVEAEVPDKIERGSTDAVCVIGMIGVQVQGSVHTGERIYTSTMTDGIAIPESHLPIGSFYTKENTMLGMAMEPHTARRPGEFSLVKCFVCIVLGISSQQLTKQVQYVLDTMETNLQNEVKRSSKKTWRRIYCLAALGLFLLIATAFLLYQLLAPGTLYRYWRCSIGAKPGHKMTYKFPWDAKEVEVNGLEFDFDTLVRKFKETVEKSNVKLFNETKTGVRYYLNLDRCAYGGETDGGFFSKTVKGGIILVNTCPCDYTKPIFKYVDGTQWCAYVNKKPINGTMKCTPAQCTADEINYSPYYPTYENLEEKRQCNKYVYKEKVTDRKSV